MPVGPPPRAIRCTKTKVDSYHRALSAAAEKILSPRPPEIANRFRIEALGVVDNWKRVSTRTNEASRISFTALSNITTAVAGREAPAYVLRLPSSEGEETTLGWWLSWFEEWETVPGSTTEVTLRSSSLHFYCGNRYASEPQELVFRAEWGPFALGLIQSGNAAQPHWHAHHEVYCQAPEGGASPVIDLRGFHLPMGGWTHSTVEPATCWQFASRSSDPSVLREWAIRTIRYLQTQLGEEKDR